MSVVGVIASVVLGIAFVIAGGAKIAAGPAWPTQAAALGAPRIAIPTLPWLEIAIGAALVVQLLRPAPAIAAMVLLGAFSALIVLRLAQGERPVCACFGAWSAKPIGAGHLARNGALAVLGVLALAA